MKYDIMARRANLNTADGYGCWEYVGEWAGVDAPEDAIAFWMDEQKFLPGFEQTDTASYRIDGAAYDVMAVLAEDQAMSRKKIAELLNQWCDYRPDDGISESNVDIYLTNVTVNDKTYNVYLGGNDEMFEVNEFYQMGVTKDGKIYRFYFSTTDENGEDIPLDCIDYTKAYRAEEVTRH